MKITKKLCSLLATLLAFALFLTACGGETGKGGDDGNPVMMYLKDTLEDSAKVNFSVKFEANYGELTDSDLEEIKLLLRRLNNRRSNIGHVLRLPRSGEQNGL